MISEARQEQAALYALGLLDADEATAFENILAAEPDLPELTRDLWDATAQLAWLPEGESAVTPPAGLRGRILSRVAAEAAPGSVTFAPVPVARPASSSFRWLPWGVAAVLLGCCALLFAERVLLQQRIQQLVSLVAVPTPAPLDALSKVAFVELEPTPDAPVKPRAAVLWDPKERRGVLRVEQLAPPDSGKDYQLWAVEAGRKEPVNAGLVHVNTEGQANFSFQPDQTFGDKPVVALAISLERAGGSPTNQGPILFLGKL